MNYSSILSILSGIFIGFLLPPSFMSSINILMNILLCIIIFLVGIEVGCNKFSFKDIKKHGGFLISITLSIIFGSLLGGFTAGLFFQMEPNISLSISSGFGWASLSGIILTNLHNAEIGAIAFLTNIIRWLIGLITIPLIAKYLNYYSAIAPAGVTSMDSSLPVISRYTDSDIPLLSIFNGILLTLLVPVLIPFFYSL